jgi:hypothetical protein
MKDSNYKQLVLNELKWLTIYLAVAFVIMLFLPFPVDLAVALLAFLALSWYKRNLLLRKLGMENARIPVLNSKRSKNSINQSFPMSLIQQIMAKVRSDTIA